MNEDEKRILKAVLDRPEGLLSPSTMINSIASQNTKAVNRLVSLGYIEEVPQQIHNKMLNFYRITEQGRATFHPAPRRFWLAIRADIKTIVVSVLTALVTTIVTIWITNLITK